MVLSRICFGSGLAFEIRKCLEKWRKNKSFCRFFQITPELSILEHSGWSHLLQNKFYLVPNRLFMMQKTFLRKMGPTTNFYNEKLMNHLIETAKKDVFFYMFKVIFCALKANPRQSDFFLLPKRPKRTQKTFSWKMGPPRMFYDWQIMSYLKKTKKNSFFSHFGWYFYVSKVDLEPKRLFLCSKKT